MAWEALVDAHVAQALEFITLFDGRLSLEEALNRYIREMDMGDTMGAAVRTRVLITFEEEQPSPPPVALHEGAEDDEEGWKRFRPDVVMRTVMERQKHREEVERMLELAIARAEEGIITTHVDNAITFAALLENEGPLSKGVEHYIAALSIHGGRGQAVLQRTMAKLADVHLPRKA
ncbi:MAG TPA: hypothetical protein VM100_11730 [Longimicrobiales bacterium]|nr:hypothetical protein [Longimicrobiales bacterium]